MTIKAVADKNTGNAVQNILINNKFKKVYNLSGGFKNYKMEHK